MKRVNDEGGHSLIEVMASMAILAVAATIFTSGMLQASRMQLDARKRKIDLSQLKHAVTEEYNPSRRKALGLVITFGDVSINTKAGLQIYESEDGKTSLQILVPEVEKGADTFGHVQE